MNSVNILGVKINRVSMELAVKIADSFIISSGQNLIITANPELINNCQADSYLKSLVNQAAMVTADGIGLLWAAKYLSLKSSGLLDEAGQLLVSLFSIIFYPKYLEDVLPERVTGADLMDKICELAAKKNWKIFLLGGQEGIAVKTKNALLKKYANLNIVGAEEGPQFQVSSIKFQVSSKLQITNNKFQKTIENINQLQPDIFFVAFGAPKQELWLNEFLPKMPSVKLAMGVGGAFDFISGQVKRAPVIYRQLGLEWLFRLIQQPRRIVRIFNATIKFMFNVIKYQHNSLKNSTNKL